jgi:two-component system phosphate regulon response regulator PhoB
MSRGRVLVVEDDAALVELLEWHLTRENYEVEKTADGDEALLLAVENPPDLILLDWMIEGVSGIEVCRRLRRLPQTTSVPIIMLTARGEEEDRVRGLQTGADDYITKPFSPRELVARVSAVLRRLRPALSEDRLIYGDVEMDTATHKVQRAGKLVSLGPTEFRLLRHFLSNPRRVFSRERLLDCVWGRDAEIELRTVDVHIRRLRRAINDQGSYPDIIRTVRSAGYALDKDGHQASLD